MRTVTRRRELGGRTFGSLRQLEKRLTEADEDPRSFCRPLGLDFIITPESQILLIELQHGFGRRGLLRLFPEANRSYRKTLWALRREHGKSRVLAEGIRRICSDKIKTYKLLSHHQPASFVYRQKWTPRLQRWLESLSAPYLLAKPPRASCGERIVAIDRKAFLRAPHEVGVDELALLQEYVASRPLAGAKGTEHYGCIRHIVLLHDEGGDLGFIHVPSYWRVSPVPFVGELDREALTANVSRGAYPVPVRASEARLIHRSTERICTELVQHILEIPSLDRGTSRSIA